MDMLSKEVSGSSNAANRYNDADSDSKIFNSKQHSPKVVTESYPKSPVPIDKINFCDTSEESNRYQATRSSTGSVPLTETSKKLHNYVGSGKQNGSNIDLPLQRNYTELD